MRIDALHRRVVMDARTLQRDLNAILPATLPSRYHERVANLKPLMTAINRITVRHRIRNEMKFDRDVPAANIKFTAEWLPEDGPDSSDIRVFWHVHPRGRRVVMTPSAWTVFRFNYWSYVLHELIHRQQDFFRKNQSSPRVYRPFAKDTALRDEQVYRGSFDEIEAYAHDAVLELLRQRGALPWDVFLHTMQQHPENGLSLPSYAIYKKTFADNEQHPVLPQFHRKMRAWYEVMVRDLQFYRDLDLYVDDHSVVS